MPKLDPELHLEVQEYLVEMNGVLAEKTIITISIL